MTDEELAKLSEVKSTYDLITADMLENKSDRVLLEGYTCNRADFVVSLEEGTIFRYIGEDWDKYPSRLDHQESWKAYELVPDKRVYADRSDFEFCALLRSKGMNFTLI